MRDDVAMSRTLPVIVVTWQFECCGDAFAIGDEVSWRLSLVTDDYPIGAARTTLRGSVGAELVSDVGGDRGSVMTADGLVAWVRPTQPPGVVDLSGTLIEDHHGLVPEEVPCTHGRVTRIRVASVAHTRADAELWPVPGSERLRDISSFADRTLQAASPSETPDRQETDLLVDLLIG